MDVQTRNQATQMDMKLYEEFFSYIEEKGISQSQAAIALGYSSGVVSAYKQKKYAGNLREFEERVKSWFERERRKSERLEVPVAQIKALENIHKVIEIAQDEKDIAVVTGDAGTGKTVALEEYEQASHSAFLIEVDPSFTKIVLIQEIAKKIGVNVQGNGNSVTQRIIHKLKGTGWVMMIDEADYLSDSALEWIRRVINDKSGIGVVLCGLPRLEYKLKNIKGDHEQLASRAGIILHVDRMKQEDAEKILKNVWGNINSEMVKTACKIASGSVRILAKIMKRAHRIMSLNGVSEINSEIIHKASELLMV